MYLAYLLLVTGLTISTVAIYYSVIGMAAIFAAAPIPIYIMGTTLEIAKLVGASWLKAFWVRAPRFIKLYMVMAIVVLMTITSIGIFGFLSKAHLDQNIVSGNVIDKVSILDEKIKTQRDNIDTARKALTQMDVAVDQTMERSTNVKGSNRAVQIRRSQAKERTLIQNEISTAQLEISKLTEEKAPFARDLRKVEAEVGPIKYIAALIYGDNPSQNILEKAVTWVIIMIVVVFDPLAVVMLLAAQMTFVWATEDKKSIAADQPLGAYISDTELWDLYDSTDIIDEEHTIINDLNVSEDFDISKKPAIIEELDITEETDISGDIANQSSRLRPIDQLYKEYADNQFADIIVDSIQEPELDNFIKESKVKPRFNNYSYDKLKYFAERIIEIKPNYNKR
jgi:hypothetical protein